MNTKASEDLRHIREMMEKSSRFISLSGLSGVGAGFVGLFTGITAMFWISDYAPLYEVTDFNQNEAVLMKLIVLGVGALLLAVFFGCFFTLIKSKRLGIPVWTATTKRVLVQLALPLVVGGIFVLALLQYQLYGLVAGTTLIFYGLALTNVERYTFSDIKILGILEIILGCIALFWIGKGLVLWTIGFGVLHILYGIILYKKYK